MSAFSIKSLSDYPENSRTIDVVLEQIRHSMASVDSMRWAEENVKESIIERFEEGRGLMNLFMEFIRKAEEEGRDVLDEDLKEAEDQLDRFCELDKHQDLIDDGVYFDVLAFYSKLDLIRRRKSIRAVATLKN